MKRLLVTFMVIAVGLSVIAPDISAQSSRDAQASKRQQNIEAWKQDMQKFNAKIKEDPAYGRVVCRCETITEGEILEAIRRPIGAATVDGVKRRVGAGMGRCQGMRCRREIEKMLEDAKDGKL